MATPSEEDLVTSVRDAIRESELPQTVLARDARLSPATLQSWMKGKSQPKPNSVHYLADGLEKRAALLRAIAERLRRAAEREEGG